MVILVLVEAGSVLRVLSEDEVEGADAETLLTTEETMERSTVSDISRCSLFYCRFLKGRSAWV